MIIVGERRWRGAQQVEMQQIPCIVKEYTDRELYEVALIENLQRENLTAIEEANAYQYLMNEYQLNHEQMGEALGKSRSYVANTIRLLQLSEPVINLVKEGKLSGTQGRALLGITNETLQLKMARRIMESKLNVRQVEEMVRKERKQQKAHPAPRRKDPELAAVETRLQEYFSTKVKISTGTKKGKIEIEYYTPADLERILAMLDKG